MGWQAPHILHTMGRVEANGEEKPGTQGPFFLSAFKCVAETLLRRLTGRKLDTSQESGASLPPTSPSHPA